ncbi:DUF2806 domain-containing protein [Achromobacter denitrificans]|nr:DUF2806 domain-containing protein [Achromobacter denitrificans]
MQQSENSAESSMSIDVGVSVQANLDPIVQATPKGLSTLLSLLLGKRYIDARRQATLSAAQNTVDAQKILEGKGTFNQESGALVATPDSDDIRELVRAVVQEEEITNLINCTISAANDLSNKQNPDDEEVSKEFLHRWRNEAKFISEETAQAVWGKILSEAIQAPNSISIRTLDVIKSLTREEAEAFREACKFVAFGEYLIDSTVDGTPIPQENYGLLRDAGLIINYQKGVYRTSKWPKTNIGFESGPTEVHYLQVGEVFIYVESGKVGAPPSFPYWQLSKAGREMCRIISRELEYDVAALGKALTIKAPELTSHLKHTVYTNVEKRQIDFNAIRAVF